MDLHPSNYATRRKDGAISVLSPPLKPENMEEKPTLRQIFDAEESALLRYAFGILGQREAAEDVVQESFMRLHSLWHEVESPRPWLFRCVRNLAFNHIRDNKRTTPLETTSPDSKQLEIQDLNPDASLGKMEAIGTLQLLIAALPEPDKTLVSLKYISGLRYEEIARQTNLTVSNVGYKLHHILKSLATSLRQLGIESAEG
jgi:RNA polymerase sigma factor (sigma-70 family)